MAKALPKGHPLKKDSVHFVMIPDADKAAINLDIEKMVERMQTVVELGRNTRERKKVGLKTPLKGMSILNKDPGYIKDMETLKPYVMEELNVMELTLRGDTQMIKYG